MTAKNEWNPSDTTPPEAGVYQTEDSELAKACFQHWNGEYWGYCSNTADEAASKATLKSHFQRTRWRGLAENPNQEA